MTENKNDVSQLPVLNNQQYNQQQESATVVMWAASDHEEGDKETRQKNANTSKSGKKRIIWGRMSVCGKVCCFIGVVLLVLLAVMIPVTYCILVPRAVQGQVDRITASSDQLVSSSVFLLVVRLLLMHLYSTGSLSGYERSKIIDKYPAVFSINDGKTIAATWYCYLVGHYESLSIASIRWYHTMVKNGYSL